MFPRRKLRERSPLFPKLHGEIENKGYVFLYDPSSKGETFLRSNRRESVSERILRLKILKNSNENRSARVLEKTTAD